MEFYIIKIILYQVCVYYKVHKHALNFCNIISFINLSIVNNVTLKRGVPFQSSNSRPLFNSWLITHKKSREWVLDGSTVKYIGMEWIFNSKGK